MHQLKIKYYVVEVFIIFNVIFKLNTKPTHSQAIFLGGFFYVFYCEETVPEVYPRILGTHCISLNLRNVTRIF
jgi:hypothetical protein